MSSESVPHYISRRLLKISGVLAVLITFIVIVSGIAIRTSDAARLRDRADTQAVPTVAVIAPGDNAVSATLDLPGRLEAYSRAPIYARVSGYLKSWKVDIGSPVKAGQLLAEIDTPDLDQQLLQARADLASANANAILADSTAKRWQSLYGSNVVSRQAADEKSGDSTTKQAMVNAAQANVDRFVTMKNFARIVAPFDGIVTARSTDVGALINAGGGTGPELFVVSDTKKLRVYVGVPQNYVSAIKRGTVARISVPEQPGQFFPAQVEASSQSVSSATGSMLIQLAVTNADARLLSGGFARVRFDLAREGAFQIPPSALIFDKSGLFVATVGADDKVILKAVTIARDLGKVIELASGIVAEDRVIESPPDGIANGDLVRVASTDAKTSPTATAAERAGKTERARN